MGSIGRAGVEKECGPLKEAPVGWDTENKGGAGRDWTVGKGQIMGALEAVVELLGLFLKANLKV